MCGPCSHARATDIRRSANTGSKRRVASGGTDMAVRALEPEETVQLDELEETAQIGTVLDRTSRVSQVVTLIAVIVPPLGVLMAMGLLWGIGFHWIDVVLFARPLHDLRVRDDDRLPPLLHAQGLRGAAVGEGDARDPRVHDDAGPADPVGHRPSQAPRALRSSRETRTRRTSATGRARSARCTASSIRTSAGCSRRRGWSAAIRTARI